MFHSPLPISGKAVVIPDAGVVMAAIRCWRAARDVGQATFPALHSVLAPMGHDQLGPVFDSVLRLCEACLERSIRVGWRQTPSADEYMLCALITDPILLDRIVEGEACAARPLGCALRAARMLLRNV